MWFSETFVFRVMIFQVICYVHVSVSLSEYTVTHSRFCQDLDCCVLYCSASLKLTALSVY